MREHPALRITVTVTALLISSGWLGAQPLDYSHFAGTTGGPDAVDGAARDARFCYPHAAAFDSAGNLYVVESCNQTIRRMTPSGEVTTLAGLASTPGSADGAGSAARFSSPSGITTDGSGHVYVADRGNHTIRKIVTATGVVTTLAGRAGSSGSADGTGDAARFKRPSGVATDGSGVVFVADEGNAVIRKITPAGVVSTFAGKPGYYGGNDGPGTEARFTFPTAVATDLADNLYVADNSANTIRRVTPQGAVTTIAGSYFLQGSEDGTGAAARFRFPQGIAVDPAGILYVADTDNASIRRVTPAGVVTTLAGSGALTSVDGTGRAASFRQPFGTAVDPEGNVVVTEGPSTLRRVTPAGVVTTIAGLANAYGSVDATGSDARFWLPVGVATSRLGNVYVADRSASTIRKISPNGVVTTLAGSEFATGAADGPGASARFSDPSGVAVDSAENVYVADSRNNAVRKISPSGVVTTLAGDPTAPAASTDGTGSAARFYNPSALATDADGNLFVVEDSHTVRRVTPSGLVTTLAGRAGQPGSADGAGTDARFNYPRGIATDASGNVYVADSFNDTIRKVTPSGVVTTLAGAAGFSGAADGVGGGARFNSPSGVTVDSAGSVWVADTFNCTLRKVTAAGTVTTEAGVAGFAGSSDGRGTRARFYWPTALAFTPAGRLFVADSYNASIRVGAPATLLDAATIDAATAPVGEVRQLDTAPRTASRWQWSLIRKPSTSAAALSATDVRDPTFAPDVADLYVFRLVAGNGSSTSITTVSLTATGGAVPTEPVSRLLPIVLDISTDSAHYVTELALTNNTTALLEVSLLYTASLGSKEGSGTVTDRLAPGEQKKIADVLAHLRAKGLAIPSSAEQAQQGGTLLVSFEGSGAIDPRLVSAAARTAALTTAPQPSGRAGLAYSGLLPAEASSSAVTIYGLRSTSVDRTNVAVFNTSGDSVTLKVTVCSGSGDGRCVVFRAAETLPPYGWTQYGSSQILDGNGITKGWAIVERTSETGSFGAYGVINDNATNDGSFVLPVGGSIAGSTLTVPVLVETPDFRSELTLANKSTAAVTLSLSYVESLSPSSGGGGTIAVTLGPLQEAIIPEAIDFLRRNGIGVGAKYATSYGGALRVTVSGTTAENVFAGARTASQSPAPAGGQFGLFTPCVYAGQEASTDAYLYGLRADAENRTNVAVVNAGSGSAGQVLLQRQAYDGDAGGVPKGTPLSVSLSPGQWAQPDSFFKSSGVANGWVKVTRMSGTAPWIAYAVVNDGSNPGLRTGDGAYMAMVK